MKLLKKAFKPEFDLRNKVSFKNQSEESSGRKQWYRAMGQNKRPSEKSEGLLLKMLCGVATQLPQQQKQKICCFYLS